MAFVCIKRCNDKLEYTRKNNQAGEDLETMSSDTQLEELGKEKLEGNEIIVSNYVRALW